MASATGSGRGRSGQLERGCGRGLAVADEAWRDRTGNDEVHRDSDERRRGRFSSEQSTGASRERRGAWASSADTIYREEKGRGRAARGGEEMADVHQS